MAKAQRSVVKTKRNVKEVDLSFDVGKFKGGELVDDLDFRNAVAYVKYLRDCELVREKSIVNRKNELEVDKVQDKLCYREVVVRRFEDALNSFVQLVNKLYLRLVDELQLSEVGAEKVRLCIDELTCALRSIDVGLVCEDSNKTDKVYHATAYNLKHGVR